MHQNDLPAGHLRVRRPTHPDICRLVGCLAATLQLASLPACDAVRSTAPEKGRPGHSEISVVSEKVYAGKVTRPDSVWYSFAAEQYKSFVAILQIDSGSVAISVSSSASQPALRGVEGHTDGTGAPGYVATAPIRSDEPQSYILVITGQGSFHLSVHQSADFPEKVSYLLPVGDTVMGETIDDLTPHDVDEFRLVGKPGDEYNILLQVLHGDASEVVRLEVPDAVGNDIVARGDGRDTSLAQHATGSFLLPPNGVVNVRVAGVADWSGNTTTGAYRLIVYRIDRQPEVSPGEVLAGDSILTESIDFPSDVDRFAFSVPSSTLMNVSIRCVPSTAILWTRVINASGQTVAANYECHPPSAPRSGTGRMLLAPGAYTIQVNAPDIEELRHIGGYEGRYDLYVYQLDDAPERVKPTLAVGDAIEGESLDPMGDADNFELIGRRGDDINIHFHGLDDRWAQNIWLFLGYSSGRAGPLALAYPSPDAEIPYATGHIVLPEDGSYPIIVAPSNSGASEVEAGPYRVVIERVSRAVEHHSQEISVGDVVTDERLDERDDVDEFNLVGVPGQAVAASITAEAATMGVRLEVVDLLTRETLQIAQSAELMYKTGVTGPFNLSPSGSAAVRVYRAVDLLPGPVGGYELEVHSFDPAPENVDASIAIGDTVFAESIYPRGDVDEYTFSGVAGDRLKVFFTPITSPATELPLDLDVFETGSDQLLTTMSSPISSAELQGWATQPFTLPETGSYVVRIRGSSNGIGRGSYSFTMQRVP